jgi:hypothetical protein
MCLLLTLTISACQTTLRSAKLEHPALVDPDDPFVAPSDLEEIVLPIRVHILHSSESSRLNCGYTEAEITAWFERANTIWSAAAIHWDLESFVYEQPNNPADFDRIAELGRDADPEERRTTVHSTYPLDQKLTPGWNIFFIHRMAFGSGVYSPENKSILIGETSPDGEFNPSILAHELGHSLGLRHTPERYNLMAKRQLGIEPKDKIRLNPKQIARARSIAESGNPFPGRYAESQVITDARDIGCWEITETQNALNAF